MKMQAKQEKMKRQAKQRRTRTTTRTRTTRMRMTNSRWVVSRSTSVASKMTLPSA